MIRLTFNQFKAVMTLLGVPEREIKEHGNTYTCMTKEGLVTANGITGTISMRRKTASWEKNDTFAVTDGVALYQRCCG